MNRVESILESWAQAEYKKPLAIARAQNAYSEVEFTRLAGICAVYEMEIKELKEENEQLERDMGAFR